MTTLRTTLLTLDLGATFTAPRVGRSFTLTSRRAMDPQNAAAAGLTIATVVELTGDEDDALVLPFEDFEGMVSRGSLVLEDAA